jgi:hypothetical protein
LWEFSVLICFLLFVHARVFSGAVQNWIATGRLVA